MSTSIQFWLLLILLFYLPPLYPERKRISYGIQWNFNDAAVVQG